MHIPISKPDLIALAAGLATGLIAWAAFLPGLPVICFFIGLMAFGLTQKALQQSAARKAPKPGGPT